MGRKRSLVPTYRHHEPTNQAYIYVTDPATGKGDRVYLGVWESPESRERYREALAELAAGKVPTSKRKAKSKPVTPPLAHPPAAGEAIRITWLARSFLEYCRGYYKKPDGTPLKEVSEFRRAVDWVLKYHARETVEEFGPQKLRAVRDKIASSDGGRSRYYANKTMRKIRRMFEWGAGEGMVTAATAGALKFVKGLAKGRGPGYDTEKVKPVPRANAEAILPHLVPTVRAMVQVQLATGCRPQDVRGLKPEQIDRTGEPWVWNIDEHKTAHRGDQRELLLGPIARGILGPLLDAVTDPGAHLFSSRQARTERYAVLREKRKSKVQPSQASRAKPLDQLKRAASLHVPERYYQEAIERACEAAGVPRFTPNQIRHLVATEVRKKYGLDGAQYILGHKRADVTQVYAERNRELAERIVREMG